MNSILESVRAVVVDAVGTVMFPKPPAVRVYERVARSLGSKLHTEEIARRFAASFAREEDLDCLQGWRTSEERERERWQRIVRSVLDDVTDFEECFQHLFDHFARPESWHCPEDAARTLGILAGRGLEVVMASNYDRRLRGVVAGHAELACLRQLIVSSEVGWRKPAPEFFCAICRLTGYPAEQILFVGDDFKNDYQPAMAMGMKAILYDPEGEEVRGRDLLRVAALSELPGM